MAKKQAAKVMVKKKRWITIISPKLFNEKEIGETYVTDPESAIGRKMAVSLMTLTGDPQKQNIHIKFLIKSYVGDKLTTEIIGWSITPSAAKKMMRRNRSKIEDSFLVKTADEKQLRIKPILITRGKAKGGVMTAIRKELKLRLTAAIAKTQFEQFIRELVMKKFQRNQADGLRKLHPVVLVEMKKLNIVEKKK